jgi:hypothetical protein
MDSAVVTNVEAKGKKTTDGMARAGQT